MSINSQSPFSLKATIKIGGKTRIVVVHKPSAGGEISTTYLARAKPDGYTVGFINVPGFVFIPMYKQATYKTDDVRIIAHVVDDLAGYGNMKNIIPIAVMNSTQVVSAIPGVPSIYESDYKIRVTSRQKNSHRYR